MQHPLPWIWAADDCDIFEKLAATDRDSSPNQKAEHTRDHKDPMQQNSRPKPGSLFLSPDGHRTQREKLCYTIL